MITNSKLVKLQRLPNGVLILTGLLNNLTVLIKKARSIMKLKKIEFYIELFF